VLTVLSILGVLAVLFVAAAVATREGPVLADAPVDAADVQLPDGPLQPEDLRAVRFALAVRGYRMDEVDRVIERAATELATRDERIAALATAPAGISSPARSAVAPPVASVVLKPASASGPADASEPSAPDESSASDESSVPAEPTVLTQTPPPVPAASAPVESDVPADPEPDATTTAEPTIAGELAQEPVASLLNDPDPEDDDPAATVGSGEEQREPGPDAAATEGVADDAASEAAPDAAPDPAPDPAPDAAPDKAPVDAAAPGDDATAVPPPTPPPVEVAVVRTEVAPVPTAVRLPAADEDESPAT
jgi:DivIVA domain-containing protein